MDPGLTFELENDIDGDVRGGGTALIAVDSTR
jgi:hypothetical protein